MTREIAEERLPKDTTVEGVVGGIEVEYPKIPPRKATEDYPTSSVL